MSGAAFIIAPFLFAAVSMTAVEPVSVTVRLGTNRVAVGSSTVVHVYAEIVPELRTASVAIFSWNVDTLLSGTAARLDFPNLSRPRSDNDLPSGSVDGPNIRSVRDTFFNVQNAGRDAPIELFSIPVLALSAGRATIAVQAGTLADDPDFVVEPIGDGPELIGGNYSAAVAELVIFEPQTNVLVSISQTALPENKGKLITLSFPVASGFNYTVEAATNLAASWQALAPSLHNAGFADDTNSSSARFYRVRITEQ